MAEATELPIKRRRVIETPPPPRRCPFAGLDPYDGELAAYFKGRESDTKLVTANLLSAPLTILMGPSGVGKSSLLMAGVIPALQQRGAIAVSFRHWQSQTFAQELKKKVRRELRTPEGAAIRLSTHADKLPFDHFVRVCVEESAMPLAFVFDQFEEYFLYDQAIREGTFDAEFARAINRDDTRCNFLLAVRDDELGSLDRLQKRIADFYGNTLRLPPLTQDAATRAVTEPLEVYAKAFPESGDPVTIEPELVQALLNTGLTFSGQGIGRVSDSSAMDVPGDAAASAGVLTAGPEEISIELPYLQLVLETLWTVERGHSPAIRLSTLKRLGGAQGIVRNHVRSRLHRLSPRGRAAIVPLIDHLVTPKGSKIAQDTENLVKWGGFKSAEHLTATLRPIMENEARILRSVSGRRGGKTVQLYELHHDMLAPALQEWQHAAAFRRKAVFYGSLVLAAVLLFLVGVGTTVNTYSAREMSVRAREALDWSPDSALQLASSAVGTSRYSIWGRKKARRDADSALALVRRSPLLAAVRVEGATHASFADSGRSLVFRSGSEIILRSGRRYERVDTLWRGAGDFDAGNLVVAVADSARGLVRLVDLDTKRVRDSQAMLDSSDYSFVQLNATDKFFALQNAVTTSVFDVATGKPAFTPGTDDRVTFSPAGSYARIEHRVPGGNKARINLLRMGTWAPVIPPFASAARRFSISSPDDRWFLHPESPVQWTVRDLTRPQSAPGKLVIDSARQRPLADTRPALPRLPFPGGFSSSSFHFVQYKGRAVVIDTRYGLGRIYDLATAKRLDSIPTMRVFASRQGQAFLTLDSLHHASARTDSLRTRTADRSHGDDAIVDSVHFTLWRGGQPLSSGWQTQALTTPLLGRRVADVQFSADGRVVAIRTAQNTWDVRSTESDRTIATVVAATLLLSPDGTRGLTIVPDSGARVWRLDQTSGVP